MIDTPASPLETVDIEALFSAPPDSLSDADFRTLVREVRRRRSEFHAAEAAKAAAGKKANKDVGPAVESKPPKTAAAAAKMDIPIAELDLTKLLGGGQ
jgi:hypothetical protein